MKYLTTQQMQDIHNEIDYYGIIVTTMKSFHGEPSIGYTYQVGYSYIIKILEELESYDAYDFLLAHEVRHVTHGHFHSVINDVTLERITKIIQTKIKTMKDSLKQQIANNDADLIKRLFHYFHNIAADMEVNSKLIEDYNTFKNQTHELISCIPELRKELSKDKTKLAYGVHPSNLENIYGTGAKNKPLSFPVKMDFIFYMEELVKHMDFDSLQVNVISAVTDSNMNKKDTPSGGKKLRDIEEFNASKQKKDEKPNAGNDDKTYESKLEKYTIYNNLRKYIYNKTKTDVVDENIDILYNYNRRKFSNRTNQTLIPKVRSMLIENFANTVIVTDVSSSMSEEVINNIVNTIFKMKLPAKLFKLVTWNMKLVQDIDINSKGYRQLKIGGGTEIGLAFPYVKQYLNSESRLFIISDLDDYIEDWKKAMDKLPVSNSNIFIIDVAGDYQKEAKKLFKNYYKLFQK